MLNEFKNLNTEIQENEYIELNDILEKGNPSKLIQSNIQYILNERNLNNTKIVVDITEEAQDAVMGYYTLSKDNEEFKGVFIANGYLEENQFDLISLSIGDNELKYFGL